MQLIRDMISLNKLGGVIECNDDINDSVGTVPGPCISTACMVWPVA